MTINLPFSSLNKGMWMREISKFSRCASAGAYRDFNVVIKLPVELNKKNIEPFHIVTLACLMQQIKKNGCGKGSLTCSNDLLVYLKDELHINDFFISEASSTVFNTDSLWNIHNSYINMYSQHIAEFLHKNYYLTRDPSALKVILDELYSNIADHAMANGVAYSFIKYEESTQRIQIAFCDFGIGIPQSLKKANIGIESNFIEEATKIGVSAHSNSHNKGYGLNTVVSCISAAGHIIKIASGKEMFLSYGDGKNRTYKLDFEIPGTLIYFELPVSSFEELDLIDEFEI